MKFNLSLLIFIIYGFSFAGYFSINPKYKLDDLYDVFNNYQVKDNLVSVRTLTYVKNSYIQKTGIQSINLNEFKMIQAKAENVFRAKPAIMKEGFVSEGTAFHVGENFVLTNYHVYDPEQNEIKDSHNLSCGNFSIVANESLDNKEFSCKKVHFCSKSYDFCLIEMDKIIKKKLFSGEIIKTYELKQLTGLNFNLEYQLGEDSIHRVIGNPQFKGIHASKGTGLKNYNKWIMFYSPVFQGNSGGPLLNEAGEVIGVVRAQSPEIVSDNAYNFAVPLVTIKKFLEHELSSDILDNLRF